MKTQKPINRYSKWQYVILLVTIVMLAISALPNLYGEQAALHIRPANNQPLQLNTTALYNNLEQQGFEVKHIHNSTNKATVLLTSNQDQAPAQQYLKTQLGPDHTVAMSMLSAAPQWLTNLNLAPIKLGLDLRGGVQFLLDVDTQVAIDNHLKQMAHEIKTQVRSAKVFGINVTIQDDNKIVVKSRANSNTKFSDIKREISQLYPNLTLSHDNNHQFSLHFDQQAQRLFKQKTIKQNLHILRDRIEQLGITEAVTQQQGKTRILIELPGVQDPTQARRIIGATASLDLHQFKPSGGKAFKTKDGRTVRLNPIPVLPGEHIKDANVSLDELGKPQVLLILDSVGGNIMTRHSQKNIGQPLVTLFSEYYQNAQGKSVKDSEIINIATIQSVLGSRFSITNMQSMQSAAELALLLRAGSLTAPVTIVAESTIGPSLGQDNINNGMAALMLGLGIILIFMAMWYRRLGLVANVALTINLICLLGLMSLLPGAVLTLPGIAGLVLTVGMAVDTNVLIFERIKEEKRRGRSLPMAVEYGYNNAFTTILDANITTFITAMILYSVGYGPVKGFAITLGLGILTSMFSGVFASRAIVNLWINNSKQLLTGVAQ